MMQRLLLLSALLLFSVSGFFIQAQVMQFTYDTAGNRTIRQIINMTRSSASSDAEIEPIVELLSERTIQIYPNPTKGELLVNISEQSNAPLEGKITLYNMSGQQIRSITIQSYSTRLDISDSPNGIYVMQIEIDGGKTSWKIIKE